MEGLERTPGGEVRVYVQADFDDTVNYYRFRCPDNGDDLLIGPDTDDDALKYDAGNNTWDFTSGNVNVGVEDSVPGQLSLNGGEEDQGGILYLYLSSYYDNVVDRFSMEAIGPVFRIGNNIHPDLLTYDTEEESWIISAADTETAAFNANEIYLGGGGNHIVHVGDATGVSIDVDVTESEAIWFYNSSHNATLQLADTSQQLGLDSDTRIELDQSSDSISMYIGSSTAQKIYLSGLAQRFGSNNTVGVYLGIDQSSKYATITVDNIARLTVSTNGAKLQTGATVNEFSTDETFAGNSDTAVPTEKAVKAYVDNQVGNEDVLSVTVQKNTYGVNGVLTVDSTTGNWIDADSTSEMTVGLLAIATEAGTGTKNVSLRGVVEDVSWSWTPNDQLYVGTNGEIVNTPPDVEGDFIQVVGYALSATTIYFNPSPNYAEVGP